MRSQARAELDHLMAERGNDGVLYLEHPPLTPSGTGVTGAAPSAEVLAELGERVDVVNQQHCPLGGS